jgi:hypothetical protein
MTSRGTSILGRSARKSVSQVGTQASVAKADEADATAKLAFQASVLMRVPASLSTL